ncbi:MAG TPA: YciI family protein [Verrucomicrobiae bacterium]|nr:YciI family protein [Verrucomicrobiae bacterium]
MKHFLLEGEHLAPFNELEDLVEAHHEFLQRGYDEGHFLFSGPHVPPHGGFLVARFESLAALQSFLAEEPFVKAGKMRFSRTTEFQAVQLQPILDDWFNGGTAKI